MTILFRARWSEKRIAASVLFVVVATIIWTLETDSILPAAAPGAISCRDYKDKINSLYELFPKGMTAEDRCAITPPACGPTGLIFNSRGMATYYYRSACYADLAKSTLDSRHCDDVEERWSLFFDGRYYSRDACLERVASLRKDRSAPKIGSENIARIDRLAAEFDGQQNLVVHLTLAPERPVPGHYAINVMATLEGSAMVYVALNPEHPAIAYDRNYDRLRPVSSWILRLEPERMGLQLRFPVNAGQLREYRQRIGTEEFSLEVQLQFLESADGALADSAQSRDAYISEQAILLRF